MGRTKDLIGQHENLKAIKKKLEQNSLVELRLGFEEGEFRSKRDVQSLVQVIEQKFHHQLSLHKYSCLRSISIGWRLPNFALGPVLQSVIPSLLKGPVRVTHLQLILNDNPPIPEACLRRIISWHSLESIDLRSITLQFIEAKSSKAEPIPVTKQVNVRRRRKMGSDESKTWVRANVIYILSYISTNIKSLKLMGCGIKKNHIPKLCEFIRKRMHGLESLSLRRNFTLDGNYHHLFELRGIKSLDLSLCDLDENDGFYIAHTIEKAEVKDLEQLNLAGNYRLSSSIPHIVSAGATMLSHIDCSFCGTTTKTQREVFDILGKAPPLSLSPLSTQQQHEKCTIQSFRMQGIMLNDAVGLVKCIRNNSSIRSLILDHPHEIRPVSVEGMQQIVSALEWNYSLEVLKLDLIPSQCPDCLETFEFWLNLNRCGRRALLQTNEGTNSWTNILTQAAKSNDHNVLFWLLKHGSVMLNKRNFVEKL